MWWVLLCEGGQGGCGGYCYVRVAWVGVVGIVM